MAVYDYNTPGDDSVTIPKKLVKGDVLVFNPTHIIQNDMNYTGTLLDYTFPFDCTVRMDVAGARGGKGNKCNDSQVGKGARVSGNFNFLKGDKLLVLVGQHGTDHGGNSADGTTGGGGGGTFVVKKTANGDLFLGSGVGNNWKVTPLMIGAGGNGGRDIGYSGTGTVYHGLGTSTAQASYSSYSGGGYNSHVSASNRNSGKSFLSGGNGADDCYNRAGFSVAGFGGGGGNKDDGEGGGGGGYFGGTLTSSAVSYISNDATNTDRVNGENFGHGYLKITFLTGDSINARCKVNGEIKNVESAYIKSKGVWKEVSEIRFKQNGAWKQV